MCAGIAAVGRLGNQPIGVNLAQCGPGEMYCPITLGAAASTPNLLHFLLSHFPRAARVIACTQLALKPAQRSVHSCNGLALMEQRGPKLAACRRRYRNALHYSKRRLDSKYSGRYGTSAVQPLHCPHRLAGSTRAASTASTIPRPSVPHRSVLHALTAAAEAGAPPTLQWAAAAGSPSIPMGVRPSVPVAANRAGW